MIDWIKTHVEAIICFSLFGLLVVTSLYFLSTEEQRLDVGELEEIDVDESRRDEVIEKAMRDLERQRQRLMTAFADRPVLHYDFLLRRNPFHPLAEVETREEEPEEPEDPGELEEPEEPEEPPPPPRRRLAVRGIVRFGDAFTATIENRDTGETYFRRVGEEVEGHRVEDISMEKVILSKDDEIIELRYGR